MRLDHLLSRETYTDYGPMSLRSTLSALHCLVLRDFISRLIEELGYSLTTA